MCAGMVSEGEVVVEGGGGGGVRQALVCKLQIGPRSLV